MSTEFVQRPFISRQELANHATESDCWIAVDIIVLNVTNFLKVHPAGKGVLLTVGGKDATSEFYSFHKKEILQKYMKKLCIGYLEGTETDIKSYWDQMDTYTPFAENVHTRGWFSPYMNDSHKRFRAECRKFMALHILPQVEQLNERGADIADELMMELGKSGILASRCGPSTMPFVKQLGIKLPGGTSPDDFNHYHEMIAIDEIYRCGYGGVGDGLGTGYTIGIPPLIHFGRKQVKARLMPDILMGKIRACLAISEPSTGSDVGAIQTTARLNSEETHYIVNGSKKWITGSGSSSPTVYTTAVRTGGPGHAGISLLLVEDPKSASEGSITKHKIKTS